MKRGIRYSRARFTSSFIACKWSAVECLFHWLSRVQYSFKVSTSHSDILEVGNLTPNEDADRKMTNCRRSVGPEASEASPEPTFNDDT
uniref:Uncharacterized protein n=1 Tax=Steinernema glaseri TaxID=37863 RepID=A0A1I7Z682_9BILA